LDDIQIVTCEVLMQPARRCRRGVLGRPAVDHRQRL